MKESIMEYVIINYRANKEYRYATLEECRSFGKLVQDFLAANERGLYWDGYTLRTAFDEPVLTIASKDELL